MKVVFNSNFYQISVARLAKLTPPGCEARIDLTITDEYPLAQAFVIISAVPAGTVE